MKKIINAPEQYTDDMLRGIYAAYPDMVRYAGNDLRCYCTARKKQGKVAIITGGGTGHLPLFLGYVGENLLDGCGVGGVFQSPGAEQIYNVAKQVEAGAGILFLYGNYTGDIMNFDMAREMAEMDGIRVESVVVRDDVAVPDSTYSTGRRGIAGTVFVHKIAGAKAETGASLDEVKAAAEKAIANIRSMGMAMTPCTLPAVGKPGFELADDEIEIGMGIHGEPGVERTKVLSARETAQILLDKILDDYDFTGSEVALMVNGLGGTPLMELYILNNDVQDILAQKGIKIYKTFVGNYMTAIEMAGCSLTLMKLDEELKELLDAPCSTTALTLP